MTPPKSVLVYSVEDISGDGLIKLPFLGGLRDAYPDAHIAWCAATGNSVYAGWLKPVVEGLIDEMILDGRPGLEPLDWIAPGRPLGGRRFDLVIDTQANAMRALAVRRAAGGAFISSAANFALSNRKPAEPWPEAMVDQLALLLRLAGGEGPKPVTLADPKVRALAEALLPAGPTYVGFGPGAGGPERRWPLENYLEVARRQHERGRIPVFVLGPGERDYVAVIRESAPYALMPGEGAGIDAAASGPLLTIALAGRMSAAVAADAGPGHMLAAGGAPLVTLFRERRKALKFRPAAPRVEPLIAEDYGDKDITLIPVDAVDAALERLLVSPTANRADV